MRVPAKEWLGSHYFHRHNCVKFALKFLFRFSDLVGFSWLILEINCSSFCDTWLTAIAVDGSHALDMIFMLIGLSLFQYRRTRFATTTIDYLLSRKFLNARRQFSLRATVSRVSWTFKLFSLSRFRLLMLFLFNEFGVIRWTRVIQVRHYFKILLDQLWVPLIKDNSSQISHHLPILIVNCVVECFGHSMVRLTEPVEIGFLHEIALGALSIGP